MQGTLFERWLSGFYDAEGCIRINRSIRSSFISYSPRIIINNTDFSVIERIVAFLLENDINCYVRTDVATTNRKPKKTIEVGRISKVLILSDILLRGSITKSNELKIIREFCESRSSFGVVKGKRQPYSEKEIEMYSDLVRYKAHKKGRVCLTYEPFDLEGINEVDPVWFAGFSDGDGSFNINKAGTPSYCVGCTNLRTINSIKNFLFLNGINYYYKTELPGRNHLPTCKLRMHTLFVNNPEDIIKLIDIIGPFLISKKEKSSVIYEYCLSRKQRKGKNRNNYEISLSEELHRLF